MYWLKLSHIETKETFMSFFICTLVFLKYDLVIFYIVKHRYYGLTPMSLGCANLGSIQCLLIVITALPYNMHRQPILLITSLEDNLVLLFIYKLIKYILLDLKQQFKTLIFVIWLKNMFFHFWAVEFYENKIYQLYSEIFGCFKFWGLMNFFCKKPRKNILVCLFEFSLVAF